MRIYIASPYTSPTESQMLTNVNLQIDAGLKLIQLGHQPFIPLLAHYADLRGKEQDINITYEQWMEYDLHWLEQCEALLFLGESSGSLRELRRAKELGMPVYCSIEEIERIALSCTLSKISYSIAQSYNNGGI